jgi:hypothetical protein
MTPYKPLSPEACYVLILRGKLSDASRQLELLAKSPRLTIGELKRLQEAQINV